MKKRKKNNVDSIEEDLMNLSSKEEEIIEFYDDLKIDDDEEIVYEEEEIEEVTPQEEKIEVKKEFYETPEIISTEDYEEEYDDYVEEVEDDNTKSIKKVKRTKLIINIVFTIIILMLIAIATDVICVARYNVGPFFAIPLKDYDDGGSRAYYGLGYKVIKYNQLQGRRDKEIGFWTMKYNATPITNKDVDLAIEFYGNEKESYEKYYKKFVRITSKLQSVDTKKHTIKIGYIDEDGKYTLEINCSMIKDQNELDKLKIGEEITIIGTVNNFKKSTNNKPNRLYVTNCFAEQ